MLFTIQKNKKNNLALIPHSQLSLCSKEEGNEYALGTNEVKQYIWASYKQRSLDFTQETAAETQTRQNTTVCSSLYIRVCVGGEEYKERVTVGAITVLKRIISSLKFGPPAGTTKHH